jgi:hypothetical protein
MSTRSTGPSADGARSPAGARARVIRSVSLEGELTLIPQTTETHLDCLAPPTPVGRSIVLAR